MIVREGHLGDRRRASRLTVTGPSWERVRPGCSDVLGSSAASGNHSCAVDLDAEPVQLNLLQA